MKEDRKAKQLARLQAMQRHQVERLERQRLAVEARFERARQRLDDISDQPTDQQKKIIEAALELLNEEGLNELSVRKLASKLRMHGPGLYWHFKNKEALIDHMAEAILAKEFADLKPCSPEESWQEWFITICKRLRQAMLSHRDGARIVAGAHLFPAVTLVKIFECSTESLVSAGIDEEQADLIISTATHFTFGRVIEEQSMPSQEQLANFDINVFLSKYPYLARSVERIKKHENLVEMSNHEFEESLRLIIHTK
jgi:TetR/AcrR family tetracycline transcriptional repressor